MDKCKCGKDAVGYMIVPTNVFGVTVIIEKVAVCDYHKQKALSNNYKVEG